MSEDFVELAGNIGAGLGLSRMACRLYALLYVRGRPLSLDKMAEELGVSKGNVSLNIRALERWEAVRKVWKKGSRKDYYAAEEDIGRIVASRLSDGIQKRIETLREHIRNSSGGPEGARLGELEKHLDDAEKLVKLLGDENIRKLLG